MCVRCFILKFSVLLLTCTIQYNLLPQRGAHHCFITTLLCFDSIVYYTTIFTFLLRLGFYVQYVCAVLRRCGTSGAVTLFLNRIESNHFFVFSSNPRFQKHKGRSALFGVSGLNLVCLEIS